MENWGRELTKNAQKDFKSFPLKRNQPAENGRKKYLEFGWLTELLEVRGWVMCEKETWDGIARKRRKKKNAAGEAVMDGGKREKERKGKEIENGIIWVFYIYYFGLK